MTLDEFLAEWHDGSDTVVVRTSGSTGVPKAMRVEKKRMEASARMTLRYLGLQPGQTALLCMPLDYIAAKMMVVRALVGGLRLLAVEPSGHPLAHPLVAGEHIDFAAMVPLQVYNTMGVPAERERLAGVGQLIIGGGAVSGPLADAVATLPHPVWSTYGMTETLSHIAMRRLNGGEASPWYELLPGVTVAQTGDGCLTIDAPAVCPQILHTHDVVRMHDDGRRFMVVGRKDNVVCSGGVKIQAEEVEKCLQPYIRQPFFIGKEKDEKFGEILVLVVENGDKKLLEDIIGNVLPQYWKPRKIRLVTHLPLTETGKPRRNLDILE